MDSDYLDYISEVQTEAAVWRDETLEGEVTAATQALHTAVEAAEVADLVVKAETYSDMSNGPDEAELAKELGDVVVAGTGVLTELGLDGTELLQGLDVSVEETALDAAVELIFEAAAAALSVNASDGSDPCLPALSFLFAEHEAACEAMGLDPVYCTEAALDKNNMRDWEQHQEDQA